MPAPEELVGAADHEIVAAALGLAPEEIGFDNFRPSLWSAGISFTYVPVRGLDALKRCEPKLEHWEAAFTRHERSSAYVFCRETVEPGSAFHARMFAPRLGSMRTRRPDQPPPRSRGFSITSCRPATARGRSSSNRDIK
jgi:trans-2,3-dihydro-3-hydroxyanthranilate isomerase